jgi:DNA repair ATPase RecN
MAIQARVTSTDALESFRASLIVFLAKARRSIDDVSDDVRRTRQWLQHDQRILWEGEWRRRTKALQQAQQELASVRLAKHQEAAVMARQAAVSKAQRAVSEAEDKIRKVKSWSQNFDNRADPVVKRLESLRQLLDHDMPKAITYLATAQRTLEAYAETSAPAGGSTSGETTPAETESGTTTPTETGAQS